MANPARPSTDERFSESLFTPFCDGCGTRLPALPAHAIACPSCGSDLVLVRSVRRSSAKTAALLSLFVPGAGQVYNGSFVKGFVIFATCWLVVPWIFGVIDAYCSAQRAELAAGAPQIL